MRSTDLLQYAQKAGKISSEEIGKISSEEITLIRKLVRAEAFKGSMGSPR